MSKVYTKVVNGRKVRVISRLRKDRLAMLIMLLFLFVITITSVVKDIGTALAIQKVQPTTYAVVRVEKGDSLWSIVDDYCPDYRDMRSFVDEVRDTNGMNNSLIYPGSELIIPIYPETYK